ncbi:Uu.00g010520.m01.CDS01 [Anthostomella pinea]|uniref:Uu.00g010520.m01.CDS01 n=1 Tax=Anthostomella pinea TaxID=933095 RepID=A0AAI8YQ06_9PEZI|nr:Uu.00g010520.m01.CDS01 [Anthostomella pinea]
MGSVMGPGHSYVPQNAGYSPDSFARRGPSNRESIARSDRSSYNAMGPAYSPKTQRPNPLPLAMMGNYAQIDARPTMYQRRPSSIASTASSAVTNESFDGILGSPTSSRTSHESWQSAPRSWQRPAPIKQYRRRRPQGELLAVLPDEVLGLILDNLRGLHLAPGGASCATCMMRDLCSVAVSARKLLKVAQSALYEDIQLVGSDLHTQKKRLKLNFGSRLVLLRRTLRSNPELAIMVHSLKAPAIPQGLPMDLYSNLVASVLMACPNFERLVGFHLNYDFSFNRLFHALSTREQLREIHWTLEASPLQRKRRMSNAAPMLNSGNARYQEAPGDLQEQQSRDFFELHSNWSNLTTLSIHCLPGATLTPVSLLPDILSDTPSLQTLHLSHLPFTAFNDANLLSLPSLHTLTMSHLPGVSSAGLSSFARRPSSRTLRELTLHHIDVDSLPTIGQILSNLTSLETLAIVQTQMPQFPEDEMIWLFPYLASSTLNKLHWDITSHPSCTNMADSILAKSIAASGFPSLRTLRAPHDPDGVFQSLCKPLEKVEMASDKYRGLIKECNTARPRSPPKTPTTPSTPKTLSKSPGMISTTSLAFPMEDQLFPSKVSSNLSQSRRAAQARLEAARQTPRFTVNVVNEDGSLAETWGMAGYMGDAASAVDYCVRPDAGAVDENGGLVEIADVLGDGGENLRDGGREGCTGRWNTWAGIVVDKRDKERWWHTERGRWRGVELA